MRFLLGLPLLLVLLSFTSTARVANADPCKCWGCWSQTMNQITCPGGGNPPLIVPTFQTAGDSDCKLNAEGQCGSPAGAKACSGSCKVRVSFPGGGSCRTSVWVQGGAAFPIPTEVNATTVDTTLSVTPNCGAGLSQSFLVWYSKPTSPPGPAGASYVFTVTCSGCQLMDPCP